MASHRLKRTMRAALATTAVVVAVGLVPGSANADPSAKQQLDDLSHEGGLLNEQYRQAEDALNAKADDLDQANRDAAEARNAAAEARSQEEQYRQHVDLLTSASFEGARFTQLSALLTSSSTRQFLEQASALDILATENKTNLDQLLAVVTQTTEADNRARDAQQRAQQATDDAAKIRDDLAERKKNLDAQLVKVRAQLDKLSAAEREKRNSQNLSLGSFVAPGGIRGAALQAALDMRGTPYVWGGASPTGFDCSGLVLYAYAQFNVALPHSAQSQSMKGQAVPRSELQPGDLVFFGSPGNIHHVGIYVGEDKMVHASDFGIPVRIDRVQSDYAGARRIGP